MDSIKLYKLISEHKSLIFKIATDYGVPGEYLTDELLTETSKLILSISKGLKEIEDHNEQIGYLMNILVITILSTLDSRISMEL